MENEFRIEFTAEKKNFLGTALKMSKRTADDGVAVAGGQPPIKKVQFEPHLIGPVSTLEELDIKVLQFQNKKLAQVIDSLTLLGHIFLFGLKTID